jgi:hypothetical protein
MELNLWNGGKIISFKIHVHTCMYVLIYINL